MTAAADGHIDIVKMLLQHNANVTLKDKQGWKAADHAVMNGIHRYQWTFHLLRRNFEIFLPIWGYVELFQNFV